MTEKQITRKQSPKQITAFGARAAEQLVDLVNQNKWSVNIQGNNYLRFEAWQTVGRFFGYTIKTEKTNYVELGESKGFEASANVLDASGLVIGGAESVCMDDEKQWAQKPLYALKSMAQTRAGARALRQVLSWVVVLAGYKPTPAEEMGTEIQEDMISLSRSNYLKQKLFNMNHLTRSNYSSNSTYSDKPASDAQKKMIFAVSKQKGLDPEQTKEAIKSFYNLDSFENLMLSQAKKAIDQLLKKPNIEDFHGLSEIDVEIEKGEMYDPPDLPTSL